MFGQWLCGQITMRRPLRGLAKASKSAGGTRRHDARRDETGHEAGACEGGLAGAARAVDQQEALSLRRVVAPEVHREADVADVAEEDRRVFGAERIEHAERRALRRRPSEQSAAGDLVGEPFAQQRF